MRKEATRNAEMCHTKDQRADPIWSIVSEHVSVSAWVSGIVRFPWVFFMNGAHKTVEEYCHSGSCLDFGDTLQYFFMRSSGFAGKGG